MRHTRWRHQFAVALGILAAASAAACGGDSKSPTSPSPSTPSRIINVSGNLAFGDVPVGSSRDATLTITNSGNSVLTVSSLSISGGLVSQTSANWTSGQIQAGGTQTVSIRFAPTAAGSYNGQITINGDQTSGTNTVAISGNAVLASVAGNWDGRYVVERCDGTGSVQDIFCSTSRGLFPVGSSLPITLSLTQNGSVVAGTIAFGTIVGPVIGSVSGSGALVLQGTATSTAGVTLSITSWSTAVSGTSMIGQIGYNLSLSGTPGVAAVTGRLAGVTK